MHISLDLETTGLIGDSKPKDEPETRITCVGICTETGVQQFSAPPAMWNASQDDAEKYLLAKFSNTRLLESGVDIITYNGNSFDFPLLNARLEHFGLPKLISDFLHVDQMDFTLLHGKYRVSKEEAAAKFADMYVPKTTRAVFFARAYMFGMVTPRIHAQMLQHNAVDVTTTWSYHSEMLVYPDYQKFIGDLRAKIPVKPEPAGPIEAML